MSIWVSHDAIGTNFIDKTAEQRGNVLTYAEGFSNHHPNHDGTHERPASIGTAHTPPWCVPGHREAFPDYDEHGTVGPWLRLDLHAPEALNFWRKDDNGNPAVERLHASVVLDETAAKALMGDLMDWLMRPKVHPMSEDQQS